MDTPHDKIQDFTVICEGGLDNKNTFIELSRNTPGAATQLVNFEPGLYGGYRRINGFQYLDETYSSIDSSNAEGKVLGIFIFKDEIYAMRKQQSSTTYRVYRYDAGSGWVAQTTGFTLNTVSGTKVIKTIRHKVFNFGDGQTVCFVDGVNPATLFDGTNWTQIVSTNTGADFANAGGAGVIDAPSWVESLFNHLFLTGDVDNPAVIAHSSPRNATDWTIASGAGQIIAGFDTNAFKPWRDRLYVFGRENTGYIALDGTDFVFKNVSDTIGCVSPDTLVEINGDLLFLSQDGFRPIAGTDKIDDVELGTLSRKVQKIVTELSATYPDEEVRSVVIRNKSQVRFFFNSETVDVAETRGILVGIRETQGNMSWEWGELLGIQAVATATGRLNDVEYVLHGDYAGNVFRQEVGNSFNGANIQAIYSTPFLDIATPLVRKKLRDIHVFVEPEGVINLQASVKFDWKDPEKLNPAAYTLEGSDIAAAVYGGSSAVYGATGIVYGAGIFPVLREGVQGTFHSVQVLFSTNGTEAPYAIQTLLYEFTPLGRR